MDSNQHSKLLVIWAWLKSILYISDFTRKQLPLQLPKSVCPSVLNQNPLYSLKSIIQSYHHPDEHPTPFAKVSSFIWFRDLYAFSFFNEGKLSKSKCKIHMEFSTLVWRHHFHVFCISTSIWKIPFVFCIYFLKASLNKLKSIVYWH